MEYCSNLAESIPFIKKFADSNKINPAYIFLILCFVSLIIIQKTFLGSILSAILTLYFPLKESLLSIQSPNPKMNDLKRLLTIFITFGFIYFLECLGIKRIIPLFSIIKIIFIFWVGSDERHSNLISEMVFNKIPLEWIQENNSIENAVKKAAKSVEEKITKKVEEKITKKKE
jgi:hypothetical protein